MKTALVWAALLSTGASAAPPTCNAGINYAAMTPGSSYTLDGSGSTGATNYLWKQVTGRSNVRWSSHTVAQPTITSIVGGAYRFQLTVSNVDGSTTCYVTPVGVTTAAATAKTVYVGFRLASVTGAASVRATILQSDGTAASATCAVSPCAVSDTSGSPRDSYPTRLEYMNSGNTVLATSSVSFREYTPSQKTIRNWLYLADTSSDAMAEWLTARYDGMSGVIFANARSLNPNVQLEFYVDHNGQYSQNLWDTLRATAAAYGFDHERALVHSKIDFNMRANYYATYQWTDIGYFDAFDQDNGGTTGISGNYGCPQSMVNGVLTLVGSTWADVTAAAVGSYAGNAVCAPYSGAGVTINDRLYISYSEPFDEMNFTVTTPASGVTVAWQYWNGSAYTALTLRSDTTSGLTTSGKILFTPPSNWAQHAEAGAYPNPNRTPHSKWWIRAVVTGGGTKPHFSKLIGDDWVSHYSTMTCRGWNATDSNRVNVGLGNLEYNPTPPANATARFRYQARIGGGWGWGEVLWNFSDVQGGIHTSSQTVMDQAIARPYANYAIQPPLAYTGSMYDSAGVCPSTTAYIADSDSDYDLSSLTCPQWAVAGVTWEQARGKILRPEWITGINSNVNSLGMLADWHLCERCFQWPVYGYWEFGLTTQPYYGFGGAVDDPSVTPWDWLVDPAKNPLNTTGVRMYGLNSYGVPWKDWNNAYVGSTLRDVAGATLSGTSYVGVGSIVKSEFNHFNFAIGTPAAGVTVAWKYWNGTSYAPLTLTRDTTSSLTQTGRIEFTPPSDWTAEAHGGATKFWLQIVLTGGSQNPTISSGGLDGEVVQRGDRAPITGMADYLIGANANTALAWGNRGYGYGATDEVSVPNVTSTTLTQDWNWGTSLIHVADASVLTDSTYVIVGTPGNPNRFSYFASAIDTGANTVTLADNPRYYPAGTTVYGIHFVHQRTDPLPSLVDAELWLTWFPALGEDLGVPDPAGLNGGARIESWISGASVSGQPAHCTGKTCPPVARRDYTKAIVLLRPGNDIVTGSGAQTGFSVPEFWTPSKVICLADGSLDNGSCPAAPLYFPLHADGSRGAGVSTITLRGGEGAILMKDLSYVTPQHMLYVNTSSTPGGDCTTNTTVGAHRACASFNEAEALVPDDITATEGNWVITCTGSVADPGKLNGLDLGAQVQAHTADATHHVIMRAADTDRAGLSWDTGKYRVSTINHEALSIAGNYTEVDGIQIEEISSSTGIPGIVALSGNNITLRNVLIRSTNPSNTYRTAISNYGSKNYVYNTVGFNLGTDPSSAGLVCWTGSISVYSSTFKAGGTGIENQSGACTMTVKNTYAVGDIAGGADYVGTMTKMTAASADSTGTAGLRNIPYSTATLTNVTAGSQNFHLAVGSALIGAGTNTSGDAAPMNFTTDIEGEARGSTWDIGPDQH